MENGDKKLLQDIDKSLVGINLELTHLKEGLSELKEKQQATHKKVNELIVSMQTDFVHNKPFVSLRNQVWVFFTGLFIMVAGTVLAVITR